MSEKSPEQPRGIVENVGAVTSTFIKTQPPGFVMTLLFCFGVMGLFAWNNHDVQDARIAAIVKIFEGNNAVQLERISALVKLFEICNVVIQRAPLLVPPADSKGSFNWDAATIAVAQV